jgi:protease stability complex PrcB-like protein
MIMSILHKTKPLKIGGVLMVWLLSSSVSMAESEEKVPFYRLEARYCAAAPPRMMRAIRNQRDLKSVLGQSNGSRVRLPALDFRKNMLILISMGRQPSSGYQIRITNLVETGRTLKVQIEETSPGRECMVLDMETHPCDLVLTKKVNKRLAFEVNQHTKDCQ